MRGRGSGKVRWIVVVIQSLSHVWLLKHSRLPCPSPSPRVYSSSCPLSWWCHPTISSSVGPFSSYPQSFPAPASFPKSQLFTSGGQSLGASAWASVLPMIIQGWFPLGLTDLISLMGWLSLFRVTHTEPEASRCSARCGVWEGGSDHRETKGNSVGWGEARAAGDRKVFDSPEIEHWWLSFQALHSAQGHLCLVFLKGHHLSLINTNSFWFSEQ